MAWKDENQGFSWFIAAVLRPARANLRVSSQCSSLESSCGSLAVCAWQLSLTTSHVEAWEGDI